MKYKSKFSFINIIYINNTIIIINANILNTAA